MWKFCTFCFLWQQFALWYHLKFESIKPTRLLNLVKFFILLSVFSYSLYPCWHFLVRFSLILILHSQWKFFLCMLEVQCIRRDINAYVWFLFIFDSFLVLWMMWKNVNMFLLRACWSQLGTWQINCASGFFFLLVKIGYRNQRDSLTGLITKGY